jgi:nucleoside-diphosphate-sugar epimerase
VERLSILVAGCGYVGSALAASLAAEGARVTGLRRSPRDLPPGVTPLAADLTHPGLAAALPEELDLVFYTAAADGGDEAAYRAAYVTGLANLLEALEARARAPRRVLFTSSTSVYGQHDGEWVDESSPTEPAGHRGAIMLEAEARLAASPIPALALRLGGLYGPGRTRLLDSLREGRAVLPRGVTRYTNRVHRDDAAGALRHLARLDAPPPLVLGVDDEPAERGEVLRWLADALGAPAPQEVDPGSGPHDRGKRCRNALLRSSGYEPRYPSFREGYAAQIASLRRADG